MDLREIQRLHAQFAPDSMTIDLPRQIAALPAPAAFESGSKSSTLTSRITRTGPVLRSSPSPCSSRLSSRWPVSARPGSGIQSARAPFRREKRGKDTEGTER